jgi:heterodisulfide reductase subunit A
MFQGSGAAVRIMALLAKGYLLSEGAISRVDQDLCRGCGRCEQVCPYKAIELEVKTIKLETKTIQTVKAVVNEAVCKGCGSCVVTCPVGAITVKHFPNKTIETQFESILLKPEPHIEETSEQPPVEAP